jgi:hypothetical protein
VSSNAEATTHELKSPLRRPQSRTETNLADEYHEIGIPAVAAATLYQGRQKNTTKAERPIQSDMTGSNFRYIILGLMALLAVIAVFYFRYPQ